MTTPHTTPERENPAQKWKFGDEYLPFHPQASHVNPDYRDGWNRAYWAAQTAKAAPEGVSEHIPDAGKMIQPLAVGVKPDPDRWCNAAMSPETEGRLSAWLTNGAALHPLTINLVVRFARAMAAKLAAAEIKYGYSDGWKSADWMDECRAHLLEHIAKGDPRDVAAYCMFLWHHGESTAGQPPGGMVPLTETQIMECVAKAGCHGTVKMSFESGPYSIGRPSINADRLVREIEAAHGIKEGSNA